MTLLELLESFSNKSTTIFAENPRASRVMAAIEARGEATVTEIVKDCHIGFNQAHHVISELKYAGLVTEERIGRNKIIFKVKP